MIQVPPENANDTFTDYLICPPYFYNKTEYPTFTSGTGYFMPWWSIPCFYQVSYIFLLSLKVKVPLLSFQESMKIPYFFIEDVFMGGFVADRCMVPKKYMSGYSVGGREMDDIDPDTDLLIHYASHSDRYKIHEKVTYKGNVLLFN